MTLKEKRKKEREEKGEKIKEDEEASYLLTIC